MRILIVYGTTEGHTAALARFMAERLQAAHIGVSLHDASEDPPSPAGFDAVILAASVHLGRYQAQFLTYARRHHAALNAVPNAFVSVSLSAAGDDPDDWRGLETGVEEFERRTGWTPNMIHHAAGAILFSEYDWFRTLALRMIARRRGEEVSASRDYDYTDYEALGRFVDAFVEGAARTPELSAVSRG